MNHFSSRARRAFGALLSVTALGALPLTARAEAPALKLLVRTTAFVPRVLAPDTDASSTSTVAAARARLQGQLSDLVPGAFVGRSFNYVGWSVIAVPANAKNTALQQLQKAFGAANVERILTRYAFKVPNDPLYAQQYWLAKINAPTVWDFTTGSNSVIVAVLDTGAQLSHPDLKDNLYKNADGSIGFNAVSPGKPPEDDDMGSYHGTHCAGTIGARGNNGRQVTGVNWQVKIIPVKIIDGSIGAASIDQEVAGINYVLSLKAKGVNIRATSNSYGGPGTNNAEKDAFSALDKAGILNFCAAGNESANNDTTPSFPCNFNFPTIVSVGASDQKDVPAGFSNYGATSVSIFAPGVDILSLAGKSGTQKLSGTSMATPCTAGAAALLWSVRPGLSATAMKALLLTSSIKVDALKSKCTSGGRVDLAAALKQLGPLPTPTPAPTPTPTPTPEPSFVLSGTVYASDKVTTLPSATVTVSNGLKTTSDAAGKYVLSGVKAGTYNLTATLSGYLFAPMPLTLPTGGGSRVIDLVASAPATSTYSISGLVRNVQGRNTSGISVFMNGEVVPVAVSDAKGAFKIPSIGKGDYTLSATVDRQVAVAKVTLPTTRADGNAVDVILQPKRNATSPSAGTS